jgi:hypothetical protein
MQANRRWFKNIFKSVNDPESVFYQADEDVWYFNDRCFNEELNVMFSDNVPFTGTEY